LGCYHTCSQRSRRLLNQQLQWIQQLQVSRLAVQQKCLKGSSLLHSSQRST
jgi:hypothetical protein